MNLKFIGYFRHSNLFKFSVGKAGAAGGGRGGGVEREEVMRRARDGRKNETVNSNQCILTADSEIEVR